MLPRTKGALKTSNVRPQITTASTVRAVTLTLFKLLGQIQLTTAHMVISSNVPFRPRRALVVRPSQGTKHNGGLRALDERSPDCAAQVIYLDDSLVKCRPCSQ